MIKTQKQNVCNEYVEIERNNETVKTPYLKSYDARKYLSCSQNTLNKICRNHNIFPIKILGVKYYIKADLDALFKDK